MSYHDRRDGIAYQLDCARDFGIHDAFCDEDVQRKEKELLLAVGGLGGLVCFLRLRWRGLWRRNEGQGKSKA